MTLDELCGAEHKAYLTREIAHIDFWYADYIECCKKAQVEPTLTRNKWVMDVYIPTGMAAEFRELYQQVKS